VEKNNFMKGKKGPENSSFKYRGVRQRTWGKWVVEICEPMGKRLWLGNFENAVDVVLSYDKVAREMYGSCARLNFPDDCLATTSSSICLTETPAYSDSATTSNYSEAFVAEDINVMVGNVMAVSTASMTAACKLLLHTFISSATEALEQFDVVAKSKNAGVAVKQMLDAVMTEQ